jgi:hypothetical protein
MEIGFFHLKLRLPNSKILPENGRISPKAFKSVRRTPHCLEFGIWDLEFPGQASSFFIPACQGCGVFYLTIKYSSFHPEAAQITYKELEVKRKKMAGFY